MIHYIAPSIKQIESELHRSLDMTEKKRLVHDDYSIIKRMRTKLESDANLLANVQRLEADLGRPLTAEETSLVANGDLHGLENLLGSSLAAPMIRTMHGDRFTNLEKELHRPLNDAEMRDVLDARFSGLENALGRELVSAHRSRAYYLRLLVRSFSRHPTNV